MSNDVENVGRQKKKKRKGKNSRSFQVNTDIRLWETFMRFYNCLSVRIFT